MAAGPEDILQKQVAAFLKFAAPDLLWHHPANGGFRNVREASKLKAMGVRAGVADLAIVLPDGRAAFIELKTATGRLSPAQAEFRDTCERLRIPHEVCRTLQEVETTLRAWGVTLRSRSPE